MARPCVTALFPGLYFSQPSAEEEYQHCPHYPFSLHWHHSAGASIPAATPLRLRPCFPSSRSGRQLLLSQTLRHSFILDSTSGCGPHRFRFSHYKPDQNHSGLVGCVNLEAIATLSLFVVLNPLQHVRAPARFDAPLNPKSFRNYYISLSPFATQDGSARRHRRLHFRRPYLRQG